MKLLHTAKLLGLTLLAGAALAACTPTENARTIQQDQQISPVKVNPGTVAPLKVAVARFENQSDYNNGAFSATNTLPKQGLETLVTELAQSGYFTVMNRSALEHLKFESELNGYRFNPQGADYVVTAAITEFGRKTQGGQALFGAVAKSRQQVAYAKVTLNLVNVRNSAILAASTGAAEISLDERQVLGFGSYASYDTAQNSKVLGIAIREAINNLTPRIQYLNLPR